MLANLAKDYINSSKDYKFVKDSQANDYITSYSYLVIGINILMETSLPFYNANLRQLSSHFSVAIANLAS